jgi:hypothetical protein
MSSKIEIRIMMPTEANARSNRRAFSRSAIAMATPTQVVRHEGGWEE